jgi:hypothetical protein
MNSSAAPKFASRLAALALALATLAVSGAAQSGRRIPRRTTPAEPPATSEPATPEPAPQPAEPEPKDKLEISVTKYVTGINIPNNVAQIPVGEAARRLRSAPALAVLSARDMNRKEASDLAKEGERSYILWCQVSMDAFDEDRAGYGRANLSNLVLTYVLFAPTTGKVHTQGRLYFNAYRTTAGVGGINVPVVPGGRVGGGGYSPEEAGQRVAEYVMESLRVVPGPDRP